MEVGHPKRKLYYFSLFAHEFVTARKRSLGQGNMFTGACLCTGGGVWSREGSGPGGVPGLGGLVLGSAWSRGVPGPGGCLVLGGGLVWSRGVPGGDPPDSHCRGRYASYWNAFLFFFRLQLD